VPSIAGVNIKYRAGYAVRDHCGQDAKNCPVIYAMAEADAVTVQGQCRLAANIFIPAHIFTREYSRSHVFIRNTGHGRPIDKFT
jgi:hypothetical protein